MNTFKENIKKEIYNKIHMGFSIKELHEMADVLRDIQTIEEFTSKCPNEHNQDKHNWILDTIDDELNASDKYYNKWQQTKDALYKSLAREELKHAEQLIGLARTKEESTSTSKSTPYMDTIKKLQERHNVLLSKLN